MGALSVATLAARGSASILVANRTRDVADRVAAGDPGRRAIDLEDLPAALGDVDLVVCATGSSGLRDRRRGAHAALGVGPGRTAAGACAISAFLATSIRRSRATGGERIDLEVRGDSPAHGGSRPTCGGLVRSSPRKSRATWPRTPADRSSPCWCRCVLGSARSSRRRWLAWRAAAGRHHARAPKSPRPCAASSRQLHQPDGPGEAARGRPDGDRYAQALRRCSTSARRARIGVDIRR